MNFVLKSSLGVAGLLMSVLASAVTATATSSITNIVFSVADAAPSDGVTPSYQFVTNPLPSSENPYNPSGTYVTSGFGIISFSPNALGTVSSVNGIVGVSGSSVSVNDNSMTATSTETIAGQSHGASGDVLATINNGSSDAPVLSNLLLVVSPWTQLTISADFSTATSIVGCSAQDQVANNCSASSFALMEFGNAYTLDDKVSHDFTMSGDAGVFSFGSSSQFVSSGIFFLNESDQPLYVGLDISVSSSTSLYGVSPVPEASTTALMGAGIALLGGMLSMRRRRLRQNATC